MKEKRKGGGEGKTSAGLFGRGKGRGEKGGVLFYYPFYLYRGWKAERKKGKGRKKEGEGRYPVPSAFLGERKREKKKAYLFFLHSCKAKKD